MSVRSRLLTTAGCAATMSLILSCEAKAQSAPSDYTYAARYDAAGRVTGTISPDPDGSGPNPFVAVRNSYDAAGRLTRVETGTLSTWQTDAVLPANWMGFVAAKQLDFTYDGFGRKLTEIVSASNTPYLVTQYSYDALGREECTAERLNPATWSSLPASACTATAAGSYGQDRITRTNYDAVGQVLKTQKAYGTSLQQDYVNYTYSANGKQATVTDANGNVAAYSYDGFDRLSKWSFPSSTAPGAISSTDYETYTYDANSNRTTLRKRDGRTITYTFDNLNRITVKTMPSSCVPGYACSNPPSYAVRNTYYGYDLRGLQLYARFDSQTGGDTVNHNYDEFGRLSSETIAMGGVSRTITYQYDEDGNRTRVTYPDGTYTTYNFDSLDRMTSVSVNGATALATMNYDAQSRPQSETRGGVTTSFSYDPISRLSNLSDDLPGTQGDITSTFAYNPASQLINRTRSNNNYAFTGYVTLNRVYAVNGLNQYSTAGPATFGYDSNGNLTSDGTNSFIYDVENRLIGNTSGVALTYDPMGRLYSVESSSGVESYAYAGNQRIGEYDANGTMTGRYIVGNGEDNPLIWYDGPTTGNPRALQADSQGSIVSVVDAVGNILAYNSYDEYGIPSAGNIGRYQYTGQMWLPQLGLYYYKARIYSPTLGRFLQTDPVGYKDQVDLYTYVGNDPMNRSDPDGQYEKDVHYDLTEVLAEAAGFTPQIAKSIARGDQSADDNPSMSPLGMSPFGRAVENRENWHFTTPERRAQLYSDFKKSGSAAALGIFLHAMQDSYSHAGYGPRFGHLSAGHAPDKTYNDVGKADSMARSTYDALVQARADLGLKGPSVPFSQLKGAINRFNSATTDAGKTAAITEIRDMLVGLK